MFRRLQAQTKRLSDRQTVSVEKRIFLTFYGIRKLIEAKKLSDECTGQQIPITLFPSTGKAVTHMNWHRSDEHFDFESPQSHRWALLTLCHQFVHSYVFHVVGGESGGLDGFMVASDRQKGSSLLQIDVTAVISLFESIAQDDVVSSRWTRDPTSGKETFQLSNQLPSDIDPSVVMADIPH
ncbi:MAG: hypothetical protein H7A54_19880 [Akkermansiaceae bacterium]|nr:hypothetical protein [Akkermansiaceae bacterium]